MECADERSDGSALAGWGGDLGPATIPARAKAAPRFALSPRSISWLARATLWNYTTHRAMRILVVEDEPRLLRNLAKALREEGYAVDTADAGDDGLYKAESYDYDAIVLDVMLPGLDGWQVLEALR